MDEMSMVRRLLAERPPSPHIVAEGRERLLSSPVRATARTRTKRRVLVRGGLAMGLTAAVAFVFLVGTTLVPGVSTSPRGGPYATAGSARTVLLAAALHAESTPTAGAYWHMRSLSTTTLPQSLGRENSHYTLEQVSVHEDWTTRTGQGWIGRRDWVRPKTSKDEAAWRHDGAPNKWCLGKTDTGPPHDICLRTKPGTASLTKNYFPFEIAEGHELTFAQLQQLPKGAAALRDWLIGMTRHDLDPSASADVVDYNVIQILANLLAYSPVPPGVRAAAYRALAGMPHVTSIGPTRDELGRSGIGIEIAIGSGWLVPADAGPVRSGCGAGQTPAQIQRRCAPRASEFTRTLLIDPHTSQVLADKTSVGNGSEPVTDTLILNVGWTNEAPHEPGLP